MMKLASLRNFDLIPSLHQLFHVPAVQRHSKKRIFGWIMKYIMDHPRSTLFIADMVKKTERAFGELASSVYSEIFT